jgi:glutamate--cysteine ligase
VIDVLTEELRAPITEETAELYVGGTVFKTGPPALVGVELEWLVHDTDRPDAPVRPDRLTRALAEEFDPPLAGSLSLEPGGQLELSSPPAPLAGCLAGTTANADRLHRRLAAAGLTLTGRGFDRRPPALRPGSARYDAMHEQFDARGPEGRLMMCSTAAVQVCLDAGADEADLAGRWHALHAWRPVLVGMFANSPQAGWRSYRTAVWAGIDPSRTLPPPGADPRSAYARWALDADVLVVRRAAGPWSAPAGLTFRDWIRGRGPDLPVPTVDDLAYHLTTLFPPVRAQGHLELRVLDAQPGPGWRVPAALVAALLDDPTARAAATAAAEAATAAVRPGADRPGADRPGADRPGADRPGADRPGADRPGADRPGADPSGAASGVGVPGGAPPAGSTAGAVLVAARSGMTDPALRAAGLAFAAAAAAALRRAGHEDLAAEVERFADDRTARGRCPADGGAA